MSEQATIYTPNPNGLSTEALPDHNITGRVVVELDASGRLWMEFYTNGQRQRTLLDRGNEWWNIVDELANQRRHAATAAERANAKRDEAARKRHRQVWTTAAERQGIGFARDVIKGDVPVGYGQYFEPDTKAKRQVKDNASDTGVNMADLI